MTDQISDLLELQHGVVSRRQLLGAGLVEHDVRRLLRRRELTSLHPGVYVNHNGPTTWLQRAWAAVLVAWPAALCHESAVRAADGPGRKTSRDDVIHVAVGQRRNRRAPQDVRLHYMAGLSTKVQWNLSPPRVKIEEALLDLAGEADRDFDAFVWLADAIQARRTTASRIRQTLDGRARIGHRDFLHGALTDVERGSWSVLEQGYVDRVERPHGLPRCAQQVPAWSSGRVFRDVEYGEFGLVVELDGRQFHDNAIARDRDLDRDLDAALDGATTVRLGWGQVFDRPCDTARRLAALLVQRGWDGCFLPCPQCAATTPSLAANM